jgi:hypothetical protein
MTPFDIWIRVSAIGLVLACSALRAGAHEGHCHADDEEEVAAVSFADPAPTGGITYEWTVGMGTHHRAALTGLVGAKSWHEPGNPQGLKGWTHTSNWIALELSDRAVLRIVAERQQGVVDAAGGTPTLGRHGLFPAISIYEGWDDTSAEDHVFNSEGNFWSTIEFIGNRRNRAGKRKARYVVVLEAGRYSIVVGGNPPSLGDPGNYPPGTCDPADSTCYTYTGRHGYEVHLLTQCPE